MKIPFVDLAAQYQSIREEVMPAIEQVVSNSSFILGDEVRCFEEEYAEYCQAPHAIGVDSGTSALELILRGHGIGPGDEVITAANTFIATTLAISSTGATPVLVDSHPDTYAIDIASIEKAVRPATKAIMPVHLYGQPVDMDAILAIADRHNLLVFEDACQAHGATYNGRRAGSLANAAAFSFYPAKNLGAYGDGGMIVTDDAHLADRIRLLRDYGQKEKYHHEILGLNRRLDGIQAAVLRKKLPYLDEWNQARRRHATRYIENLANAPVVLPVEADYAKSVYHLFVIRVANRSQLQKHLQEMGISTGIHYPVPIHLQPAYRHLGHTMGDLPTTERQCEELLSLPMYAELSDDAIDCVTDAVGEFMTTPLLEAVV